MKRSGLKFGILIFVVLLMSFSNCSRAADTTDMGGVAWMLSYFNSFVSWGWIVLAKMAGTLLTNDRAYGSPLGLDSLLWQYWNVVKNIANFGLGFFFVYKIFAMLIDIKKGDGYMNDMSKILKNMLIAGVGIQASWFLVAAVIDISTITLATAGALPSYVMSQSATFAKSFDTNINNVVGRISNGNGEIITGYVVSLFPTDQKANTFLKVDEKALTTSISSGDMRDALLPNANDVTGPLYYLGLSIIDWNHLPIIDTSGDKGIKKTILNIILQGGTTIVFTVEMFILFVLAVFRIFYLWMFIVLSPLIILISCIKEADGKFFSTSLDKIKIFSQINIKSFFVNVFKPTVIVMAMGIALIFVALMGGILKAGSMTDTDIGGVVVKSQKDSNNNKVDTQIITDFSSISIVNLGKSFGEIVLGIVTIVLMYFIIRIAASMGDGDDFVSKTVGSLQKGITDVAMSTPVFPVMGQNISASALFGNGGKSSLLEAAVINKKNHFTAQIAEDTSRVQSILSGDKSGFAVVQNDIKTIMSKENYKSKGLEVLEELRDSKNFYSPEGSKLTLNGIGENSQFWIKMFTDWLQNVSKDEFDGVKYAEDRKHMCDYWQDSSNKNKTLKDMFIKYPNGVQAYADVFHLGKVTNWDSIKDLDISDEKYKLKEGE